MVVLKWAFIELNYENHAEMLQKSDEKMLSVFLEV